MKTNNSYQSCIDACLQCFNACSNCANACLQEKDVQHLTRCIQLDMECAAICSFAAHMMGINSSFVADVCKLCASICTTCAEECEKHAAMGMEHCRECAAQCRKCAAECSFMEKNSMGIPEDLNIHAKGLS
jgi:hypothetical protein